ncbi:MAG: hypothetical protein JJT96_13490 [Opitutales bacterium]|nr:hypothetical protein [Opitutales bacterium]
MNRLIQALPPFSFARRAGTGALLALLLGAGPWALASQLTLNLRSDLGYDSSLFRIDVGDLGKTDSLFLGIRPELRWTPASSIRITYSAEAILYFDASEENHLRQMLGLNFRQENLTFSTTFTRVDGPSEGVTFAEGRNAWATLHARTRRPQWQNRSNLQYVFDLGTVFIRPLASLVYEDLESRIRPGVAGYDNWIDRYDLAGGVDIGRDLENWAFYAGWRYGRQGQGRQGGRLTDRSNKYHRALIGLTGPLGPRADLRLEVGPAFHRYDDPASPGGRGGDTWYLDGNLRFRVTPQDILTLVGNIRSSVSSTGLVSSEVRTFSLSHNRKWDDTWSTQIGFSARALVYAGITRKDWLYTTSASILRDFGADWKGGLHLEHEEGRDRADTGQASREFSRTLLYLRFSRAF